jgi:hypothetical protein
VQRRPTPELLDTDSRTPAEIAGSISARCFINRWLGVSTTRTLIQTVGRKTGKTGKTEFSLLEVAPSAIEEFHQSPVR